MTRYPQLSFYTEAEAVYDCPKPVSYMQTGLIH